MADLGTIKGYSFINATRSTTTSTATPVVRGDVILSDLNFNDMAENQYNPTEVVRTPVDIQPSSSGGSGGVAVKQYWG